MPIYEYQCSKCGTLEVFQRITDNPLVRCPACRSKVTKLISRSSFHLKGTGWYATDYANNGKNGTHSDVAKETESLAASKSDSSPSSPTAPSTAASNSGAKPSPDTKANDKSSSCSKARRLSVTGCPTCSGNWSDTRERRSSRASGSAVTPIYSGGRCYSESSGNATCAEGLPRRSRGVSPEPAERTHRNPSASLGRERSAAARPTAGGVRVPDCGRG